MLRPAATRADCQLGVVKSVAVSHDTLRIVDAGVLVGSALKDSVLMRSNLGRIIDPVGDLARHDFG